MDCIWLLIVIVWVAKGGVESGWLSLDAEQS